MQLLVTRPEQDAADLARMLEALGHTVVLEPLLRIEPVAGAVVAEKSYQALLVTSANGVRALAQSPQFGRLKTTPVLAVGRASGEAAQAAGFASVRDAAGDLEDLARLVADTCDPAAGPLLYAAGRRVSGDLKGLLERRGFSVDRAVLYEAVESAALSAETAGHLRRRELDGVLLYSPRTARIWAGCAIAAGLADAALSISHFCLSDAVAETLSQRLGQMPADVRVANAPNEEALMAVLSR